MKFGTEGERGGETVVSERWVAAKGGAEKGGAVELWERRADGGLRFRLKVEPLSWILHVGERQRVGLHFGGRRRQRKEKVACGGVTEQFIEI